MSLVFENHVFPKKLNNTVVYHYSKGLKNRSFPNDTAESKRYTEGSSYLAICLDQQIDLIIFNCLIDHFSQGTRVEPHNVYLFVGRTAFV